MVRHGAALAESFDLAQVGGKAAGLARLLRAGADVPPFFVLPPGAEVEEAVEAWAEAGWSRVAVRSSAVDEDGDRHSFAGMFTSVLGVSDPAALRRAIAACRASAANPRVQDYREQRGLPDAPVAVVVQQMVEGDASGVLFTRDPELPDEALISAAWGLCEGVVQGSIPADTVRVGRDGAVRATITHQDAMVALVDGAPGEVPVPPAQRDLPALAEAAARELAGLGWRLEAAFGQPLDIEWTRAGGRFVVLQARPITRPIPRGRRLLWDNSNIIESYHGPVSPLTYSFASRAYTIVYQLFCEVMGVDRETIQAHAGTFTRMIGLVRGRIYYNLNAWYTVVSLLPGYRWNRAFLEQMMGVAEVASEADAGGGGAGSRWADLPRMLRLAGGLAWRVARLDADVRGFHRHFEATLARWRGQDLSKRSPWDLLDAYTDLERRLLWAWHTPIVNDFFVMIGFGVLRKVCESWIPGTDDLHNRLMAGEGGLDSTAPTRDALQLAMRVRQTPGLAEAVADAPDERAAWAALTRAPAVSGEARRWVDRWGDRCSDELKLEVPSIRQQPWRLAGILRGYLSGAPVDPAEMGAAERRVRQQAEAEVAAALSGWRGVVFRRVLGFARTRVRDRENLRFLRTRIFGLVREIFDALGAHMERRGALDDARDVYWLTWDEAAGWVRGTTVTTNLRGLVDLRRAEYDAFAREPAPADRFHTWGPIWAHNRFVGRGAVPVPEGALSGLSACPGLVEAEVVVVERPQDAPPLDGRILVAYRTDPGWVPLFPQAGAVLVERGSLLSHSAVVARELGVPTVVAIAGLRERLRTGMRVRVDAGAGTVEILDAGEE